METTTMSDHIFTINCLQRQKYCYAVIVSLIMFMSALPLHDSHDKDILHHVETCANSGKCLTDDGTLRYTFWTESRWRFRYMAVSSKSPGMSNIHYHLNRKRNRIYFFCNYIYTGCIPKVFRHLKKFITTNSYKS